MDDDTEEFTVPLLRHFDTMWRKAEERGLCDTLGGQQYRRVFLEWILAGRPQWLIAFICRRANCQPDGSDGILPPDLRSLEGH